MQSSSITEILQAIIYNKLLLIIKFIRMQKTGTGLFLNPEDFLT